jgi:hypothetical protein
MSEAQAGESQPEDGPGKNAKPWLKGRVPLKPQLKKDLETELAEVNVAVGIQTVTLDISEQLWPVGGGRGTQGATKLTYRR